jgi:hypothetical protein
MLRRRREPGETGHTPLTTFVSDHYEFSFGVACNKKRRSRSRLELEPKNRAALMYFICQPFQQGMNETMIRAER